MNSIAIKIWLALGSASIGFGLSQVALARDTHVAIANVASLQAAILKIQSDFNDEKDRTDRRFTDTLNAINGVVKQNTELITLIRVQQQVQGGK